MEENHNNLGEFLRKRFNDFDEAQGDWAQPDKEVREKVLTQIVPTQKTGGLNASRLLIALLGLALIVGGISMIYLQKENAALKEDLQQKTKVLEAIQQQLPMATINTEKTNEGVLLEKNQKEEQELMETVSSQSSQTASDQANTSSDSKDKNTFDKSQNVSNRITRKILTPLSDQQASEPFAKISPIEKANPTENPADPQRSLAELNNSNTTTTLVENTTFTNVPTGLTLPSLSFSSFTREMLKEPTMQLLPNPLTQPVGQQRAKFEAGYAFSLIRFNLEKEVRFYRRTGRGERVNGQQELLKANGMHLAYSPAKNWWMETGLNYATTDLEHHYSVPVRYDRLSDVALPDGSRRNRMELESNNSFASEKSTLELTIPAGETIDEGEFLNLNISESQSLRYCTNPSRLSLSATVRPTFGMAATRWNVMELLGI
jgi:hypothetical protein